MSDARFAFRRPLLALTAACAALVAPMLTHAQAQSASQRAGAFKATYGLSLAGVSIGAASLATRVDANGAYELDLHAKLTGLAGVLVSGKGGARSTGRVSGERVLPETLAVVATTANDKRSLRMAFAGSSVSAIEIKPPLEDWERPDRIAVTAAHRQAVIDPLSALLMPAPGRNLAEACNRTIPVFDGATRFDVVLRYKSTTTINQAGYSGPGIVCTARYQPISGHRPLRSMTKFMQDNTDMGVTLIPVGDTGLYAPYRIHIRTTLGLSVMQATRIHMDGLQSAAAERRGTGSRR